MIHSVPGWSHDLSKLMSLALSMLSFGHSARAQHGTGAGRSIGDWGTLGIVVQASNQLEGSFERCLLRAEESFGILYSTGIRNKGYQRFTVAHQLGHYSLTDHHQFLFKKGRFIARSRRTSGTSGRPIYLVWNC